MTEYKIYKIVDKQHTHDGKVRYILDDYIPFKGYHGSYDYDKWLRCPDDSYGYQIGDYLEIDLDKSRNRCNGDPYARHIFEEIVRRRFVSPSSASSSTNLITTRGSSSDLVISPGAVDAMRSPRAMEIAREMSRMVDETGKEYEFKIEDPNSKLKYSLICRKSNN